MEVPIDYVRCDFSQFPFIRTVVLLLSLGLKAHLSHKFLDRLVVDINTVSM